METIVPMLNLSQVISNSGAMVGHPEQLVPRLLPPASLLPPQKPRFCPEIASPSCPMCLKVQLYGQQNTKTLGLTHFGREAAPLPDAAS